MLELRPSCENCDKDLPVDSTDAMICSYECTFCKACVETVLNHICPNCNGNFSLRPIRPQADLKRNPPSSKRIYKPLE